MAKTVNKVTLVGALGRHPEIRSFQNGGRVCSLNLATEDSWKDKASGEWKKRTEWHRISVLDTVLIEYAERYLQKGCTVYLEGSLETRKYTDKDGVEKYSTEVVLRPFAGTLALMREAQDAEGDKREIPPGQTTSGFANGHDQSAAAGDDEIPF